MPKGSIEIWSQGNQPFDALGVVNIYYGSMPLYIKVRQTDYKFSQYCSLINSISMKKFPISDRETAKGSHIFDSVYVVYVCVRTTNKSII